ncbi:hypothetical protein R5R35_001273 [Gryllus longicercus]|uniref:RRM domain-containing protein n=1 Tax=Gryllus longicercus TaxID=2509291 RepID=A0AAN9Z7M0_9ORTH
MSYRDLRGDNLHNMMIDPTTVNARIYVGNIPTNEITKRDVEELFQKYGPILGVSLVRGFGFVQFEHEAHALEAIKHENGVMFRGKKIEVNPARVYGGRSRGGGAELPGPRKLDAEDRDPFRDRSPIDDRARERDWRDRDRFDNFSAKSGSMERGNYYGRDGGFGKDTGLYTGQDKFRSGPNVGPGRDERGSNFGKDPYGSNTFRPSGISDARPSLPARDYASPNNVNPLERTNDCEIIVFNKAQREYAEYIEHRLKQLDISVDLLFPNEEVPISRILANISSRGSLYAISVMPQNEEHRSLTLNILHGLPQEHRNMPLEDAVPLIKRNFEAYRSGEKSSTAAVPTAVAVVPAGLPAPTSDRHPEAIQVLLGLLADNRQLTVLQYDRVIRYLQEKRELQLKLELGDAKDLPSSKEPTSKQQVDLQHRILNILNNQSTANNSSGSGSGSVGVGAGAGGGAGSSVGSSASVSGLGANTAPGLGLGGLSSSAGMYPPLNIGPVPAPVAPPSGNWQNQPTSTPLLSDPTVQKALDSLMQGNLLRKITPTTGSSTPSMSSLGTPPSQPLFGSAWGSSASKM